MDVALKQRLVGASVLVIFSVTFIPMLLDGPPSSRIESPIAIPQPPDKRFETRLLPVGENTGASESERPQAQSVPAEVPQPRPERPAVTVTPSANTAAVVDTPNASGPVSVPPRRSPASSDSTPPNQAAQPSAQVDSARSDGRWVLQLGSFGNAANAARLVERLKGGEWNAYQERVEVGSSALYRVRVRGWPAKSAAMEAGERLLKAYSDLELSVREVPAGGVAPAANALQGWMVQLGSFASESNATALRDKLRAGGFAAHVSDAGSSAGARYRVRVGPELDEASAKRTRDTIRRQLSLNGMVIDHP
ncbi:MAG: SPOR domain-containing protein [Lysobacterales bacterium]